MTHIHLFTDASVNQKTKQNKKKTITGGIYLYDNQELITKRYSRK